MRERRDASVEVDDGVHLYVQRCGEGEPIVFVHGGGMTHAAWDHQVGALMERFHTVAYDLRGIGMSDRPPSGYSIDVWAADLDALLDRLELERPTLVGYALGAHVAIRFATAHPQRIGKLVLVSAAPWFAGDREQAGGFPEELWESMQRGASVNRAQADIDLIDAKYFYRQPSEGMRLWCLQMAFQWPLPVFNQLAGSLSDVDHRAVLPEVSVRTLVVHGRHDRKNRYEGGVYLSEHLPDARLVTFEQSAHCPQLEEVDLFNETIAEFAASESAA